MSVLNNEDLDRQQKREVEVVQQVKKDFEEGFNRGCTPVLLIDPQHEINVFQVAKDNNALYIDLSHRIDYPMLCRIVRFATSIEYDAVKSEHRKHSRHGKQRGYTISREIRTQERRRCAHSRQHILLFLQL